MIDILKRLEPLKDEKYRKFIANLTPTFDFNHILGIRVPYLTQYKQNSPSSKRSEGGGMNAMKNNILNVYHNIL